jgi:hypothetical protein
MRMTTVVKRYVLVSTQVFPHEQNLVNDPSPPFWAEPAGHLSVFVSPPVTDHDLLLGVFHM